MHIEPMYKALINEMVLNVNHQITRNAKKNFLININNMCKKIYKTMKNRMGYNETHAKLFCLKISNLLVNKYEYLNRNSTLISYPFHLYVDPANHCVCKCPGCVHSDNPLTKNYLWPPGILKESTFDKFLNYFGPFATHISFYNYGEPLLNKLTPKFIKKARSFLLFTSISTNLAVKNIDFEELVLSGLDYMILSIDGGTSETYKKFKKGGDFNLVLKNLEKLVLTRDSLNRRNPIMEWRFFVFEHNMHEIGLVKELAERYGVDLLQIAKPIPVDWDDPLVRVANSIEDERIEFFTYYQDVRKNQNDMLKKIEKEGINKAFKRKWFMKNKNNGYYHGIERGNDTCDWLYKNITMDANGRIMPCCVAPTIDRNLVFSEIVKGNNDVFNSEMYKLARLSFSDREAYQEVVNSYDNQKEPFCLRCLYKSKPNCDTVYVKQYLDSIELFDILLEETKTVLTNY